MKTIEAMDNLIPGMHFHEMFCHHVFILAREGNMLKVAVAQSPCELPKDGRVAEVNVEDFKEHYTYSNTKGYWVTYAGMVAHTNAILEEFDNLLITAQFLTKVKKPETCPHCKGTGVL